MAIAIVIMTAVMVPVTIMAKIPAMVIIMAVVVMTIIIVPTKTPVMAVITIARHHHPGGMIIPGTADPDTVMAAIAIVAGHPDIIRTRARWHRHHYFGRRARRSRHHYRRRHHYGNRQRETNREAEVHPRLRRERHGTNCRNREEHFSFHIFYLVEGLIALHQARRQVSRQVTIPL